MSAMFRITLPDGSVREVAPGTTPADVAAAIGPGLAKAALAATLRELAGDGHAVLVATHDVELAAAVADRVVVLADGEVVSAGPTRTVLAESPAFAPQVTKVLGAPWLRVDEVVDRLTSRGGS